MTNPMKPTSTVTPSGLTANQIKTGSTSPVVASTPTSTGSTPTNYPTAEIVKQMLTYPGHGADLSSIKKHLPLILNAMVAAGLTSKNHLIAILATVCVETQFNSFDESKEGGTYWHKYAPYYGRGYIQLTNKNEYAQMGKTLGLDLLNTPDLALPFETAAKILCIDWKGQPQADSNSKVAASAAGQWSRVRRLVNGGTNGEAEFLAYCAQGEKLLTGGINGSNFPGVGTEGLGCVDGGGGVGKNYAGVQNPSSQGDALAMALGISESLKQSIIFQGRFDVRYEPSVLNLLNGATFALKNVGTGLDGNYIVDEVTFFAGPTLEVDVVASMPDPEAPASQVYGHDANQPMTNPLNPVSSNLPTDIPGAIWKAAQAAKGRSSAAGPAGGREACAYSVNNFCIIPAGVKPLGEGSTGSVAVAGILEALAKGRGQKIPLASVVPGDIWADASGHGHVGIFASNGSTPSATYVLSNSSSKATFTWYATLDSMANYYHGLGDNFWRVTS